MTVFVCGYLPDRRNIPRFEPRPSRLCGEIKTLSRDHRDDKAIPRISTFQHCRISAFKESTMLLEQYIWVQILSSPKKDSQPHFFKDKSKSVVYVVI